jgi:exodeoxyribonuclease III
MKIATWNVNGIRARHEQVLAWIEHERIDIVCLQETKAPRDKVPAGLLELENYWSFWHGFKGYSGVALLVRKSVAPEQPEFVHPPFDLENRIVAAVVQGITICSIYVPNGGRNFPAKMTFLTEMKNYAEEAHRNGQPLVMCGDFNVAHREMDVHPKERAACTGQLPEERALLDGILSNDLVDLGRKMAPDDDELFTWWAPWRDMKKRNIGWRLDYIYASGKLAQAATSCVVEKEIGTSDHGPVVATFDDKRAGIKQHAVAAGTAAAKRTEQLEQSGLGI